MRARPHAALLSALAAAGVACGGSAPTYVLLISIDSLRADRLGCYGHVRDTSPRIDALAREGTLFERALSSTSWTLPAHVALFTGLADPLHGVHDESRALAEGIPTLAERLREAGFETGAIVSGPFLHPRYGLARGFDDYWSCMGYVDDRFRRRRSGNLHAASHRDVTGPCVARRAREWLDAHREGPAFLFLHFWDVHYDYAPPRPFSERFDPGYAGDLDASGYARNPAIHADMAPRDLEHVMALYDGEVAWTDARVGEVLDHLDALDLRDETLVVLTSDHGDAFFEHGNKGHKRDLHAEVLRIPLILRGPRVPAGVRRPGPAHITDVAPTILELAGLSRRDPGGIGAGRSLVPALREAGALEGRRVASSLRTSAYELSSLEGLRDKIVRDHRASRDEVYALDRDPRERRPLPARSEAVRALDAWLVGVAKRADEFPAPEPAAEIDAYWREQLRALGYVE